MGWRVVTILEGGRVGSTHARRLHQSRQSRHSPQPEPPLAPTAAMPPFGCPTGLLACNRLHQGSWRPAARCSSLHATGCRRWLTLALLFTLALLLFTRFHPGSWRVI